LGKSKRPQGCSDQSRQATYFSSGIGEYQSGNESAMGKVEDSEEINHSSMKHMVWKKE
jgi:hypothetical protein